MSGRPGVVVDVRVEADGGTSPNRFDPAVSVHVRAYWPPLATDAQIDEALEEAFLQAAAAISSRRARS